MTSRPPIERRHEARAPQVERRTYALVWQARAYLAILALRYGVLGAVGLLGPSSLTTMPAMQHPVPLGAWSAAFVVMAVAALVEVFFGREVPFRILIVVSFLLTAAFASRLVVGLAEGDLRFVVAPLFAVVLALKDMVVSSLQVTAPLRGLPLPGVIDDE